MAGISVRVVLDRGLLRNQYVAVERQTLVQLGKIIIIP